MKKCDGCEKEIDKHSIACEYCGRLLDKDKDKEEGHNHGSQNPDNTQKED